MKKFTILFFIFFAQLCFSQSFFAQNDPQIFSAKPDYEFGELIEGQIATHDFEIKNTGLSDLKIDNVRASCGCTAAQPASKLLKSGESTKIKVEFDTHGRIGLQQKYVYVFTNDPKTPEFKLSFNAVVVEKLSSPKGSKTAKLVLDKTQYDFGTVQEGKIVDTKIGFKNSGSSVLEIVDVKTSCGCTAALLSSKKLNPGESGTIKIDLDTANREGKFVRTVTLFSNDPAQSNQTITLSANIEKRK